jgi:hypothetical protein
VHCTVSCNALHALISAEASCWQFSLQSDNWVSTAALCMTVVAADNSAAKAAAVPTGWENFLYLHLSASCKVSTTGRMQGYIQQLSHSWFPVTVQQRVLFSWQLQPLAHALCCAVRGFFIAVGLLYG